MIRTLVAGLCALSLFAAAPARAQQETPSLLGGGAAVPNLLGVTGLLLTPTAYTVGDRGLSAHAYFVDDVQNYGLQFGFGALEVGASLLNADNGFLGGDDGVLLHAKWALLREGTLLPQLSVGVVDALDELDVDPSWYIVASKDLSRLIPLGLFPIRAHVGFGGGLYDEEVFLGAEMNLGTPLDLIPVSRPVFSLLTEYADGNVNLGLRGRWRGLAATVALFDFDRFGGGISYTTGLRLR